ncbi:hypothetical protein CBL_05026 [Carabus blaptoides fortunei]
MCEATNDDVLHKLHPKLRKFITEIWNNDKIGICAGNIQIIRTISSKYEDINAPKFANRFTLSVPFAGQFLDWDVIFSNDNLNFVPDFDFGDDRFICNFDSETIIEHASSLANWNSENPKSLLIILKQLIEMYKKYQIKLLEDERYSRLYFEYSSLVGETEVNKEDVEVLVEQSGTVHFLISLSVDFASLPPYSDSTDITLNPGHDGAMLMVTFHRPDGSNIQPQLFISPRVEQALGGTGNKHIPSFPVGGCLMDYVPEVRKILADKVQTIIANYRLKNKYISQLIAQYAMSLIEYDSLNFTKATFLFETKNFYWLLIITISNNFPREKPKWVLRSIYHMFYDQPNINVYYRASVSSDSDEQNSDISGTLTKKLKYYQKYNRRWKDELDLRGWLQASRKGSDFGYCTACNVDINVKNGKIQLYRHAQTEKHISYPAEAN